jgi:hypothetical protein
MTLLESILMRWPRAWAAYVRWNFCKGQYADGTAKPEGPLFRAFAWAFHLECSCCSALRGLIAGAALGAGVTLCLT